MTTVHLTNAFHPHSGGVRTLYLALLDAANRLRRRACLIVPDDRTHVEEVGRFGRIYYIKAPTAPFDRRYRLLLPHHYLPGRDGAIRRILQAEQPAVVEICDKYSLFYIAGLIRRGWVRGVGRPTLIGTSAERMDDNVEAYLPGGRAVRTTAQLFMRHIYTPMFDYHLANSEYTAEELRDALPPHRQRVVRLAMPGVDVSLFAQTESRHMKRRGVREQLGLSDSTRLAIYAGRLSPEKNASLLIETLAALIDDGAPVHLAIAGDGPSRHELERQAQRDAPGRVTFLGNIGDRRELSALLAAADVFIHPNPREPFGIAPLEAMAARVPLVVPAAGGVLSYADDSTAWLAARPDAVSFAKAVRAALTPTPARARELRVLRAAQRAQQFDMPLAMNRLFDLYDTLHDERAGSVTERSWQPEPQKFIFRPNDIQQR